MIHEHWGKEIDEITEKFEESFGTLTHSQLNYKRNPNIWSIAQNIAHLILLNNSYFQNFEEIEKGNHVLPSINATDLFVADSLEAIRPYTREERPKKANTWDIWQPSNEKYSSKILKHFTHHQSDFKIHLKKLESFFLSTTFIKYPGETALYFQLEDCIDFLIEHEKRHWIQASEVKTDFDIQMKNGR